ncbi:MAG: TetR/AcrR family transcriptional regulator [Propionicimonas sp.]
MTTPSTAPRAHRTARERARAELTGEIVACARRQLAEHGAAALSLRAIARDLGMVSSALYRYFPSRDALLTRLIIEAYDGLGAAAEDAEAPVGRTDLRGRFTATCRAVRRWALDHPHEYALIYGSPVPGYRAPADTIGPATRVAAVFVAILVDGVRDGSILAPHGTLDQDVATAMQPVMTFFPAELAPEVALGGLQSFSALFGAVSFELFGQLHNVVDEDPELRDAFFNAEVDSLATLVGIT